MMLFMLFQILIRKEEEEYWTFGSGTVWSALLTDDYDDDDHSVEYSFQFCIKRLIFTIPSLSRVISFITIGGALSQYKEEIFIIWRSMKQSATKQQQQLKRGGMRGGDGRGVIELEDELKCGASDWYKPGSVPLQEGFTSRLNNFMIAPFDLAALPSHCRLAKSVFYFIHTRLYLLVSQSFVWYLNIVLLSARIVCVKHRGLKI